MIHQKEYALWYLGHMDNAVRCL